MSDVVRPGPAQENATGGFAYEEPLSIERSRPGRVGFSLPASDVPPVDAGAVLPAEALRGDPAELPELSEVEVVRHFTRLSTWNAAVDLGLYPLGSCTMKYNPKINEKDARLPGFAGAHPLQPTTEQQGFLEQRLCLAEAPPFRQQLPQPGHRPDGGYVFIAELPTA